MASLNKPAVQAESLPLEREPVIEVPNKAGPIKPIGVSSPADGEFTIKLLKKLLAVQQAVDKIERDGYNATQKYDYVSAANVLAHFRAALHAQSLIFFIRVINVVRDKHDRVNKETGQFAGVTNTAAVTLTLTIYDTESGEWIAVPCQGDGMDTGDKAVYKAITGATKYAALGAMGLSSTDDPENETKKKEKRSSDAAADGDGPKDYITTKAKWPGKCAVCGKAWEKGAEQVWLKGSKLNYCPGCVPKEGASSGKPDNAGGGDGGNNLADPKQIHAIDAYMGNPKRSNGDRGWWQEVKRDCIETVTTSRAAKIITWLSNNSPETPIPINDWKAMLSGGAQ